MIYMVAFSQQRTLDYDTENADHAAGTNSQQNNSAINRDATSWHSADIKRLLPVIRALKKLLSSGRYFYTGLKTIQSGVTNRKKSSAWRTFTEIISLVAHVDCLRTRDI